MANNAHPLGRLASLEADQIASRITDERHRLSRLLDGIAAKTENMLIERMLMGRVRRVIRDIENPEALRRFLSEMRHSVSQGSKPIITLMAGGADGFKQLLPTITEAETATASPLKRQLFYMPGGGFILPSSAHQRQLVHALSYQCGATAIIGVAGLAPENAFPKPLHDLLRQYKELIAAEAGSTQTLFIGADTAGASLMLGMLQLARDEGLPMPAGVMLFSPWGDLGLSGWSYLTKSATAQSPFRMETAAFCARLYLGATPPTDPLASPIYADLSGFPPISIHTSRNDMHFDDAIKLAENARSANVSVELHYWDSPRHHLERLDRKSAEKTARLARRFMDQQAPALIS